MHHARMCVRAGGATLVEHDVVEVVRRVVAARIHDVHLVEDLTQETLLRVAAAEHRLAPDARQAYAIVTARHLVADHARTHAIHRRHAHRLVEYTSLDGPERLVLDREETDALATALQRLDDDDRELLLRHEVDGTSTADLAGATAGASPGAVAMRLARIRATLRLEFLLAYRRLTLPTLRCRPVLLALSTGDRRRQRSLGASEHLLRCTSCAELARPLTERRRGLAGWVVLPLDALRRAIGSLRRSRTAQVATAVAVVAGLGAVLLVTRSLGDGGATAPTAPAVTAVGTAPATTVAASTTTAAPATTTAAPTVAPTTVAAGAATSCPPPLPLEQVVPTERFGCPVAPTTLTATAVPSDEGFWATSATAQAVWVQLAGGGESPVDVDVGTTVVVVGTVGPLPPGTEDPALLAAGFVLDVPFDAVTAG